MTAFTARIGKTRRIRHIERQHNAMRTLALHRAITTTEDLSLDALERLAGLTPADARGFWSAYDGADADRMIHLGKFVLRRRIMDRVDRGEMSLIGYARGRAVAVLIGEVAP